MIASRLPDTAPPGRFASRLQGWGRRGIDAYGRWLAAALRHAWWVFGGCVLVAAGAGFVATSLDQELTPQEDRGVLSVRLEGPEGVGLDYSDRQLELALAAVRPLQDQGLLENIFTVTGRYDFNRVDIVAPLADWGDRDISQAQIGARVQAALDRLPGVRVRILGGSSLGGGGSGDGSVQMAITGDDHARIAGAAQAFAQVIERQMPALRDVRVDYATSQPQLALRVDRVRAAELGVQVTGLDTMLRALVDGTEVAELTLGDRNVPVILQSSRRGATDPQALLMLAVRGADDTLVPLAQFVRIEEGAIAPELQRLGQRRAVEMSAVAGDRLPLRDAVDGLRTLAAAELPDGMGLLFRGDAATLERTGNEVGITFAIALLVVFLVLVAQFESVTSAAVVLISVPFGLAAAAVAMALSGTSLNIYSQIGLLLLVGVMAKNSILMVEFADQLRDAGRSVAQAAQEAAATRLRPILMTMASTVLGALPLVVGSGAGAESRTSIGWVIFGGLSLAALFTLFLTPVVYLGLARFSGPRARQAEQLDEELQAAPQGGPEGTEPGTRRDDPPATPAAAPAARPDGAGAA